MVGLQRSDAGTSSLLLNFEGVFSAALAWFVFREATSARVVFGFLAILSGGVLLAWPGRAGVPGESTGALCVITACLFWGLDNNCTRRISAADARLIGCIKGLVAGATNTLLAWLLGARLPGFPQLGGTLLVGFLGYGLSLVLFIVALRHLGTARTGAYFATAPFIGAMLAVLALGEPVTPALCLAALLMGLGVWLHATEHHEHEHLHEPLTHAHPHRHDEHHEHDHAESWDGSEPHTHEHRHAPLRHSHPHFPDIHHEHGHR